MFVAATKRRDISSAETVSKTENLADVDLTMTGGGASTVELATSSVLFLKKCRKSHGLNSFVGVSEVPLRPITFFIDCHSFFGLVESETILAAQ